MNVSDGLNRGIRRRESRFTAKLTTHPSIRSPDTQSPFLSVESLVRLKYLHLPSHRLSQSRYLAACPLDTSRKRILDWKDHRHIRWMLTTKTMV